MIYGYARVSTTKQAMKGNSLEEQMNVLKGYNCDEIIQEAYTGKTTDRPKFKSIIDVVKHTSSNRKPLVIIAEDITGDALRTLSYNKANGIDVCAIKALGIVTGKQIGRAHV